MNIIIFSTGVPWLAPSGGKEVRILSIAHKLIQEGHHVQVIYPGKKKSFIKDNITFTSIGIDAGPKQYFRQLFNRINYFLFAHKEIEYNHDRNLWIMVRPPMAALYKKNVKIMDCGRIFIVHISPIVLMDNLSNLVGYLGSSKRIFNSKIIPGIDLHHFSPKKADKSFDILYVGREEKAKGYDDFIKLSTELPNLKFAIAGGNKIGIERNITHLGKINHKNMPQVYNQSKLLFFPSAGESFGLAAIEAMACGIPVISYDVINKKIIRHGRTGYVVSKGDLTSSIQFIISLLNNKRLYQKMSINSRNRVILYFDQVRYLNEMYHEIVS